MFASSTEQLGGVKMDWGNLPEPIAKRLRSLANAGTQGEGEWMPTATKVEESAERVAFRDYVFRHARAADVNTRRLADVRKWLMREFGPRFESTARRIIQASTKPTSDTVDLLAEKWGERFEFNGRPAAITAPVGDQKARQATTIVKLAPEAKHAKREDLARLANEAASDPADVKLVAMMLLMFRDA
jgi:hypothetical protein